MAGRAHTGTAPLGIFPAVVALTGPGKISTGTDGGFADPDLARHRLAVHRLPLAERDGPAATAMDRGHAARLLGSD